MNKIQRAARRLISKHRSVRKAGVASGISYAQLHKLASGVQVNPTAATLEKLGFDVSVIKEN